jgi:cytochrome P450
MELTDGLDLLLPARYAERGYPHDTWSRLRRESPVHRCEPPGYGPFWAITRHADICDISKRPDAFLNAPGIVVLDDEQTRMQQQGSVLRRMKTIIEMDPPVHRSFRKVASGWFTPRSLGRLEAAVAESARTLVDALAADGDGECDFVARVAAAHPLRILAHTLGVPREDEPYILRLTNELFASEDPEFQREGTRQERLESVGLDLYTYFSKIVADRRANPRDDLASVLANARVDGAPIGEVETLGYYLIVFTAGHDTTRNAISGGLLALIENPDQLALLRRDPELAASAVEEIVRWTTPVNYMKRTAARDVELRGQKIRAGEELMLCYASANRDEEVFDDPFAFRIERSPNRHLGFGIGEHFCLGAHLARRSQSALFAEIARRVEHLELAGLPERTASSFVAGIKHLPIRYRFARGA